MLSCRMFNQPIVFQNRLLYVPNDPLTNKRRFVWLIPYQRGTGGVVEIRK